MLALELAQSLQIDQSVMSKRLGIYFQEVSEKKSRILSEQAIEQLRQAHELMTSKKAPNFMAAVQMVIGTYAEPLPPASVRMLERRLENLETLQAQTLDRVDRVLKHLEASRTWEEVFGEKPGPQGQ